MHSYQKNKLLGFTLVELIVVITIVGILSTVGFVSYSGYLTGARDSNRMSQMVKLSDSLQVYGANKTLPLPDNKIDITASGTIIAYQGEIGVDVLETIDYTNGGTDPKDNTYYTYYLTKDRKSLQLMALMEEQRSAAFNVSLKTNAINYEERYPRTYGNKLGILTYSDTSNIDLLNTPANLISENITNGNLDVFNLSSEYTANFGENNSISGGGVKIGMSMLGGGRVVGAWNFNGVSGTNVPDVSGNGNDGTLSGSTLPISILGHSGNAIEFTSSDGLSGGYVDVGASSDIDTGTFTLSFWMNTDDTIDGSGSSQIIKNYSIDSIENDRIFIFQWDSTDATAGKRCRIISSNGNAYDAQIKSEISLSVWNHYACTFDGEKLSVYLNGKLEALTNVNEPINRGRASMKIGAGGSSSVLTGNYFDGKIDEFFLYKKSLSSQEIEIIYDATK